MGFRRFTKINNDGYCSTQGLKKQCFEAPTEPKVRGSNPLRRATKSNNPKGWLLFCCYNLCKGFERERPENSGHPLFLAADRSILQSTKIELWHSCFAKCKNSNPHISTKKYCRMGYILQYFLSKFLALIFAL